MVISSSSPTFFGGIASGIDSRALIDSILGVESIPLLRLEARQQRLQQARSIFLDLDSKVDALRSAADAIDTAAEIGSFTASSSDETTLTATASGSAAVGVYTIEVSTLAAARTTQSTAEGARTNTIGSGSIDFTVNGTTTTVNIGAGDDLDAVATSINAASAGVRATVVEETAGSFRLLLESTDSGTTNAFTVDATGFTASGSFSFVSGGDLVSAADASFTFNGLSVTRSTNSVTDLVEGLTLDLAKANPGNPVTVTVSADAAGLRDKIQTFVDAYNEVVDTIGAQQTLDDEGNPSTDLFSDSSLRSIEGVLRTAIETTTTGTGSEFSSLAALGIRSDANGRLSIDTDSFDDAVSADFDGIISLFADDTTGVAANFQSAADAISAPGSGLIAGRISSIDSQLLKLTDRIRTLESRLDERETRLVDQFGALEQLVGGFQSQGSALVGLLNS